MEGIKIQSRFGSWTIGAQYIEKYFEGFVGFGKNRQIQVHMTLDRDEYLRFINQVGAGPVVGPDSDKEYFIHCAA